MKKKMKNNKGFTLVELIVVIAIIGILVAIAVPRFSNSLDKAKVAADEATAKAVQTSVAMYYLEASAYPVVEGSSDTATKEQFNSLKTILLKGDYIDAIDQQTDPDDYEFQYEGVNGVVSLYHTGN